MKVTVHGKIGRFLRSTVSVALLALSTAQAETWQLALIGDTPYSAFERAELPKMLSAIADSGSELVIHVGDFKHGKDRCDDALFADRHALFNASRIPFVFVPGDNEWSDCERLSNGGYDPRERLAALRRLFWSQPDSLGQTRIAQERQPGTPEHARFRVGPVLFVTLNVPGGNNNWGLKETPGAEFSERQPQVLAWLRESFHIARASSLAGIALVMQANPGFRHFSQGLAHSGYRELLEVLREETMAFPGQVLVIHGDTHQSRVDHPLRDVHGRPLANFTRVETHGYPFMGWTRLRIDPGSPGLWRVEPQRWPPAPPP
jgi:hypothetical protein